MIQYSGSFLETDSLFISKSQHAAFRVTSITLETDNFKADFILGVLLSHTYNLSDFVVFFLGCFRGTGGGGGNFHVIV